MWDWQVMLQHPGFSSCPFLLVLSLGSQWNKTGRNVLRRLKVTAGGTMRTGTSFHSSGALGAALPALMRCWAERLSVGSTQRTASIKEVFARLFQKPEILRKNSVRIETLMDISLGSSVNCWAFVTTKNNITESFWPVKKLIAPLSSKRFCGIILDWQ